MTKKRGSPKKSSALGDHGVLVRLERTEPGMVRVTLDDCEKGKDIWRESWTFTHFDTPEERLRTMKLPKQRLHEIGLAIIARLIALEDLE